ncbi:polysaccharide biosynthesis protein [Bulleidia extructa W1219]|jgi:Predicted nucleoside-diphosphate sugar epimerases|uniref:Polysaccharide biosynthesis protein n=1 Tax=Bulleidia extructa W1219 TaxID=679192 RepID=D2MP23_9FIRM|nr:nucleoside-diphosphate sugar epimerase/dehydratase [Bulleidia extructa]EFC05643.1 polysaccharide biosynthesis protein [Bulleidia extructa W1219]
MNRISNWIKKYREVSLVTIDTVLVIVAYGLAYFIRTDLGRLSYFSAVDSLLGLMVIPVVLNLFSFFLFHLNRSLWQYISLDEVIHVGMASLLGNMTWFLIVITVNFKDYFRSLPLIALVLQILLMVGVRMAYRLYRRTARLQKRNHRALILGAGQAGVMALREIMSSNRYDSRIVGFVDRNPLKKKQILNGISVLGTDDDLPSIVSSYEVDTAYIAIKNITKSDLKNLIEKCHQLKLRTRIVGFTLQDGAKKEMASIRNIKMDDLLGRGELDLNSETIGTFLTGKTVVVTGAGGSIGSELVRQIVTFNPKHMVLIDIYENNMYDLQMELNMKYHPDKSKLTCLIGSVRDRKRMDEIFQEVHPDVVFHAAAHKHVPLVEDSPLEAIKNNVFGTKNVIEASIQSGVDKFVLISTDKAVRTTNVMGATKRMCELLVQGYKDNGVTKLCAVRFGNVLGSNGSVIPLFEKQIESGGPVTVTDPNIIRYFMTIPEAAQLVLQAGAFANTGEIFILDMGKPVKILDLAKNLIELAGYVPDKDIEIVFTGLRPGEKLYEELLLDPKKCTKTENNLIFITQPEDISMDLVKDKLSKLGNLLETNHFTNQEIIDLVTMLK